MSHTEQSTEQQHTEIVDLVIVNAVLWSDGRILPETALAARGGNIVALGSDALADRVIATRVVDAQGGLVTPSFVDAHVHVAQGGIESLRCDLTGCTNREEVAAEIRAYAAANPEAPWILGGGWMPAFFEGGAPTRQELDELVPDRPAFLIANDHHGAWANTLGFEAAGITADTPDPEDGSFVREEDGTPAGMLVEGAAELISQALPAITDDEIYAGQMAGEQRMFSYGITGWQEAILGQFMGYEDLSPHFAKLVDEGHLSAEITGALWLYRDFEGLSIADHIAKLEERRAEYNRDGLTIDTVKVMVDGVVENATAAMEEPYVHECGCVPHEAGGENLGLAYFSREDLLEVVPMLNERGFNVHFHAIGDRAVRYALDAVAAVDPELRAKRRNHIAHVQVINPKDLPRFAELNVAANLQPLWASSDDTMIELTLPRMGEERSQWQYLFRSLEKAGALLACGSDWPVSTPDPWQGMHVAVTRRDPGVTAAEPLLPDEALTLDTVLTAYTRGSRTVTGLPGGKVEVGEPANLAIASRNPFSGDALDIWTTTNRYTVFRGNVVFEA